MAYWWPDRDLPSPPPARSQGEECCWSCDDPTGRAGRADDSLYDEDGGGPYCEDCWAEYEREQAAFARESDKELGARRREETS